jgi:predicted TIM-barrel fold metal-dependent hydrolase
MDSPAASTPRNDHRPTMVALPEALELAADIGDGRIIWSVDYPYLTLDGTREFLGKLPVSEQDREKIAHLNAEKLFTL